MNTITPFLMFQKDGKAAIELYSKIFEHCQIEKAVTDPKTGALTNGVFTLNGQRFFAMDIGQEENFRFTDGVSLFVSCDNQAEVDHYWNAFIEAGGTESQCGWLKDRFGLSWQIIPKQLGELMSAGDPAAAARVYKAMLGMKKLIVADLEAAAKAP